jgi:hypothetical protein
VYGTPTECSDLDVVIRCDPYVIAAIEAAVGSSATDYDHESISVQCGRVNLHLCASDREYDRWRQGTRSCEVVAPIDRDTAMKMMRVSGVDRGAVRDRGPHACSRAGPGKVSVMRNDGRVTPYRVWMGYDKRDHARVRKHPDQAGPKVREGRSQVPARRDEVLGL